MVTRKDVAEAAGVSVATVSHVLNKTKFVSPELEARVRSVVEDLRYIPNHSARSLVTKRTDQVGIIVPGFSNPHHGAIAEGMEEVARRKGFVVALFSAERTEDRYISRIISRQIDGLFIATSAFSFSYAEVRRMVDEGVKLVLAGRRATWEEGRRYADLPFSSVEVDYRSAYRKLFSYLSDLGHRRVAFLSGFSQDLYEARRSLYQENTRSFGFECEESLIVYGTFPYATSVQDGYRDMRRLLQRGTRVTAVIAVNDLMAIGALKAIREAGLRIPDDIAVIGCDNIFLSETTEPPLTTLQYPQRQVGRIAMDLLLRQINDQLTDHVSVEVELIIRESTGRPRP